MNHSRLSTIPLALARITIILTALSAVCLPTHAQEPMTDQVRCFTTWDADYFYLGFKVDCPDVRAAHKAPNEPVTGDDVVEFYIETANQRPEKITAKCFSMAVSAAGGAHFRAGTESGALETTEVYTFKYGATVQGTLNNSDDIDMGYSIEMAVPWRVMKTRPPGMGDMMGFNVILRRAGSAPGQFVSLSPRVKTEGDAAEPAKWVNIVFAGHTFGVATTSVEKILSAKYIIRSPLMDGIVGDKEWHKNTSFALAIPLPPGFVYEAKFPPHRMVLTHYFYWYQADPRRPAPLFHIERDGSLLLQDFPAKNVGPWFSCDRVQWHKDELADISACGIDVVLPVYWGDRGTRAAYSAKGLDCLVTALAELRAEGKTYPLVAMFFDTSAMKWAYGTEPNLKDEEVKRTFYGMIKDFFDRVPPEFRAVAQADKPDAGMFCPIIVLYTGGFFSDYDSSFVSYCSERFRKDFGTPLVWIASSDYRSKAEGFDGFSTYAAGLVGCVYDDAGRIDIASVGAGFDDSAVQSQGSARIRSRAAGETYENDWSTALARNPHWIVCDGWNELHEGSDLCASREYGRKYVEATRANVNRLNGNRDIDAAYLRCSVPKVIPPKRFALAELVIRNIGNATWKLSDGYALAYRWYKSGRYYGESKVRRPLDRDVRPGDTISVPIGIATVNAQGAEMPEGDCELRFELMRLSDNKWFSALGDQPVMVPLSIGAPPAWNATYLECSAPAMVAAGRNYAVIVRMRNDGTELWRKGAVKLACTLFRISNYTHDNPNELEEEVPIKALRSILTKDCKPGETAQFVLGLNLVRADKKPFEFWTQDSPWSYQLRFDLHNGDKWLSELGVPASKRIVDVFENDYGPRIVDCDLPARIAAGQTIDVEVVLRNMGAQVWSRKRTALGYHWYHLDGTEMLWDGPASPLKLDLHPGMPAVVQTKVSAPEYDGVYVLVWDVQIDGKWLSTEPLTRGGDILPVFVEVTGGKFAHADLSELLDTRAATLDTERPLGGFDADGASFPSEFFPPDAAARDGLAPVYPSGYKLDRTNQPAGRVTFLYPGKSKNAVACSGQTVDLPDGNYTALHILGASASGDASGEVALLYSEGEQAAELTMSDWTSGPGHGEKVGYLTRHRHVPTADEPAKRCHLHHYTLPLDPAKTLTSLKLPANPTMKIVAITAERAALPAPPSAADGTAQ